MSDHSAFAAAPGKYELLHFCHSFNAFLFASPMQKVIVFLELRSLGYVGSYFKGEILGIIGFQTVLTVERLTS